MQILLESTFWRQYLKQLASEKNILKYLITTVIYFLLILSNQIPMQLLCKLKIISKLKINYIYLNKNISTVIAQVRKTLLMKIEISTHLLEKIYFFLFFKIFVNIFYSYNKEYATLCV